jgi:serine/threonine-protein kinase
VTENSSASPVKEGDVIAGKYRVERVLGVGGMGVVVAAMHMELEQRVALKFLLPEGAANPMVAERFAREAKAAAKIRCEHVARVIDVGTLTQGTPYMVMEFMDGEDLSQVLSRCGPLPADVATGYVLQASEAVAEAHALGIVHRDLKPANLFLARQPGGDPTVKVLDFGISKSTLSASQAQLTKTTSVMGSPLYMSPEQMTSAKSVDTRSDIWALGVVLYELLTRRTPFPADTMPELVAAILQRVHDPVRQMRPDVHPALEAAINRCLEKDPARRFPNVAEFAAAIAPFGPPRSEVSVEHIAHVLGVRVGVAGTLATSGSVPLVPAPQGQTSNPSIPNQPGAVTNAPWAGAASTGAASTSTSKVALLVAIPTLITLLFAVGAALFWMKGRPTQAAVAPSAATASAAPAASAPAAQVPDAAASAAVDAAPSASAAPATPTPPTQPAGRPGARPTATPKAAPTCHTVSYFDSDGNKRFKQECR